MSEEKSNGAITVTVTGADHGEYTVPAAVYGRTFWGAQRSTFIIDENGVVAHVIKKAKPGTHDDEVLKALSELAAA